MGGHTFEIGIIGAGKMGEALLRSIAQRIGPEKTCFFEKDESRASFIYSQIGSKKLSSSREVYESSDYTILCVKPDQVADVLKELVGSESDSVLVSIAAGISTDYILSFGNFKVVRVMPNTPALVQKGMTVIAKSDYVSEDEFKGVVEIFQGLGEVLVLEEGKMNAVTALSGSGPAFVFKFIEALKRAGINVGLPADISEKLAVETVIGASELLKQSGKSTSELIEMVASPGGTTIAGLKALEKNAFAYAVMEAVEKAFKRARRLEKSDD